MCVYFFVHGASKWMGGGGQTMQFKNEFSVVGCVYFIYHGEIFLIIIALQCKDKIGDTAYSL